MSPAQIACAVLVPLLWGVQFVVIKVGLTAFPPLFFVALRFAAVAAILLPFVGRPARHELGPMIAISVFFGGLNFALFFRRARARTRQRVGHQRPGFNGELHRFGFGRPAEIDPLIAHRPMTDRTLRQAGGNFPRQVGCNNGR